MRLSTRWLRASAALALAAALGGCSFADGPRFVRDYRPPQAGEPVPASFWERPDKGTASAGSFWLLPGWLSGRTTWFAPQDDGVSSAKYEFLNLGFAVVPLLPLWVHGVTDFCMSDGSSGESWVLWTPLWADSGSTDWPARGWRPSARGVPLLYGSFDYRRGDEAPAFEIHNVLWTLGPCWSQWDVDEGTQRGTGWSVSPLFLAGVGGLVWVSVESESAESDDVTHGPLVGWLGYRSSLDHEDQEFTRRVLAGVLWYDVEEFEGDRVVDARHGPLWGMLGWGRDEGAPVAYLFWFPIAL